MLNKLREYPLVPMLFIGAVLIVLSLAMLPYVAPAHHYTAKTVSAEEGSELPRQAFAEGAKRSGEVKRFEDLSSRQQSVLRESRRGGNQNDWSGNKSLFRGFEYVTMNSTLLEINIASRDSRNRLQVTELPTSEVLSIFAVPVSEFAGYSYFYVPESEQHIVRSAIESGQYNSSIVVNVNHTVVPYRNSYYVLNDEGTVTFS